MGVNDKMVAPTCRSFLEKGNKNGKKVKFSYLLGECQIIFPLDHSIHQRLI